MPGADDLMMGVYAAMAQMERGLFSKRTRSAPAAARPLGARLVGDRGYPGQPKRRTPAQQPWRESEPPIRSLTG